MVWWLRRETAVITQRTEFELLWTGENAEMASDIVAWKDMDLHGWGGEFLGCGYVCGLDEIRDG